MKREPKKGIGLQLPLSTLARAADLASRIERLSGLPIKRSEVLRQAIELGLPAFAARWQRGGR